MFEPGERLGKVGEVGYLPALSAMLRKPDRKYNSLVQAFQDIVQGPRPLAQMRTQRVTEVIRFHDLPQGVHPSFKTAVHDLAIVGDSIGAITACRFSSTNNIDTKGELTSSIPLLSVRAVQHNVQIDEIKIAKGFIGARSADLI